LIKGVGIDIVEISRVRESVQKYQKAFLNRIFTSGEIAYCRRDGKELKYPELAARFAAKEAFVKAMGTGMAAYNWKEIEVIKETSGKPVLKVKGKKLKKAHLSLSHSRDYAAAVVYVES
jgi:holo-[acyl-carrier protein] synthase